MTTFVTVSDQLMALAPGFSTGKSPVMAFRCPDARLIGTGYIAGARLEFYLHATVEKTGDQRNRVPIAVWEINDRDERSLDRYEGFPSYYIKER